MKRGIEYAGSRQKRVLDLLVAGILTPASMACRSLITADLMYRNAEEMTACFEQERIGRGGVTFNIWKLRTLSQYNLQPHSRMAACLRKLGLDEVVQVRNIIDGSMSAVGFRPLIAEEYEQTLDELDASGRQRWLQVVNHTRPGIFSSFAYYYHEHPEPNPDFANIRAEMDYRDFIERGSVVNDIRIMAGALKLPGVF